jgi:high-affinity nickel-transport protein
MTAADLPAGSFALFLVVGLRHGMEPDHIAAIDGMTLRALDRGERQAPWVGAWFALGHATVVTVLAIAVGIAAASFTLPASIISVFDWLPVFLLVLLGVWNLRALLAPGEYRPDSLRMKLIPPALRERTDIASTMLIGVLFATVVDTLAHVSAWSVFAAQRGGWWAGLVAGLLFSAGFLATSTADSQLVCRVLRGERSAQASRRLRRGIGWFVVTLSFAAALGAIAERLEWGLPAAGWIAWMAGASLAVLLLWWLWRIGKRARRFKESST